MPENEEVDIPRFLPSACLWITTRSMLPPNIAIAIAYTDDTHITYTATSVVANGLSNVVLPVSRYRYPGLQGYQYIHAAAKGLRNSIAL